MAVDTNTQATETTGTSARPSQRASQEHRSFEWYTPEKRRASLYEDVTIDSQPSTRRWWTGPYPAYFADGRGTWWEESTRLRSLDWYAFRDPRGLWERNYYQQAASAEAAVEAAVAGARKDDLFDRMAPAWVDLLRDELQVLAFVDYGIWLGIAGAQRDTLSDTLAHAVGIEAGVKQRQFQSVVLYGMDLDERFGGFDVATAKQRFLELDAYQPLRACVERLQATVDWGELIVAALLCIDGIAGVALRRELFMQTAAANGDIVTPAIMRPAQSEYLSARVFAEELVRFSLADEVHGDANRAVIGEWIADWRTSVGAALDALAPVFAAASTSPGVDRASRTVLGEFDAMLAELGLTIPAGSSR